MIMYHVVVIFNEMNSKCKHTWKIHRLTFVCLNCSIRISYQNGFLLTGLTSSYCSACPKSGPEISNFMWHGLFVFRIKQNVCLRGYLQQKIPVWRLNFHRQSDRKVAVSGREVFANILPRHDISVHNFKKQISLT
jgi:hypothetical protein